MPPRNPTRYLHICTACGHERYTTIKRNPSGLCQPCARLQAIAALAKKRQLHFLPGALYAEEDIARFWNRVDTETACTCHSWEERCWLWTGPIHPRNGYGSFASRNLYRKKHTISAHRFAFQSEHGMLDENMHVLHCPPCLIRHCIRHLYAGTPQQNSNDTKAMHRFPTGERHGTIHHGYVAYPRGDNNWMRAHPELIRRGEDAPQAILTEAIICAIRADYAAGMGVSALARKYSGSRTNMGHITQRRSWKHIQ